MFSFLFTRLRALLPILIAVFCFMLLSASEAQARCNVRAIRVQALRLNVFNHRPALAIVDHHRAQLAIVNHSHHNNVAAIIVDRPAIILRDSLVVDPRRAYYTYDVSASLIAEQVLAERQRAALYAQAQATQTAALVAQLLSGPQLALNAKSTCAEDVKQLKAELAALRQQLVK